MPELPEVETVKNILKIDIIGKKILDIKINYNKIIKNVSEEEFRNSLINQSFIDITRHETYSSCVQDYKQALCVAVFPYISFPEHTCPDG